jgi:hypothetical protein
MTAVALWVIKQIGIAGCVLIGLLAYYEGLPFLNSYPLLLKLPLVGQLAVGHVEEERQRAAKDATAGLVASYDLDLANAKLATLQAELTRYAQLVDAARKQTDAATVAAQQAKDDLEKRIAKETDDNACSGWSQSDGDHLERVRKR